MNRANAAKDSANQSKDKATKPPPTMEDLTSKANDVVHDYMIPVQYSIHICP